MSPLPYTGISRGSSGALHLNIRGNRYRIAPEGAACLAVLDREAVILDGNESAHAEARGRAYPGGGFFLLAIGEQTFHLSRRAFTALCLGEISSAPLEEMVRDESPVPGNGGAA